MKNLKEKINELLPKMYFLDKDVLKGIEENLESFSEAELQRIYQTLSEVNEKTIDHFDKILQKNPRFFEQAKGVLMRKKEESAIVEDEKQLVDLLNNLQTI